MSNSGFSKSNYADRSRLLMGIAQKLRDIGAQALVDIPRIAVIGKQSAGKSSLVEAVSDTRLPRDGGTCTRCPMEVNMINAPGPWSCRITLRMEYDTAGVRLPDVQRIPFGSPLSSPDEVELALRRAQAALLNHHKESSDMFLMKSRDELEHYRSHEAFKSGTLKFTKNVVVMDIFDPDCANLSFVDLPGLIQNDEHQAIQLVEDLVRSNIQGNCLILVTIPMSDDMENQGAMRIALEADRNKSRTIGVLTKPDTLTSGDIGAQKKWLDTLTASDGLTEDALKLGYYCVKLPDDAERTRNPSRTKRLLNEITFFSTTSPWNAVMERKHFGVANLVEDLSKHLTTILDNILPQLRRQAQEKLDEARTALSRLPGPPLVDGASEVLERITEFCQECLGTINGTFELMPGVEDSEHRTCCGKSFVRRNRASYGEFKRHIRSTAPDFRPFGDYKDYYKPQFSDPERSDSKEGEGNGPRDLSHVRNVIQKSISWELPNNVPFATKCAMIDEFTKEWDAPMSQCFEEACRNLSTCLEHILHRHFNRFKKLHSYMGNLVTDLLDEQRLTARSSVTASLEQEKRPLFTQNEYYLSNLRAHWLNEYTKVRIKQEALRKSAVVPRRLPPVHTPASIPMLDDTINDVLKGLRELGYPNVAKEDLPRLQTAPDIYSEELEVMADVRAYFFVAYKRIVDNVPLAIERALNRGIADRMKRTLLQKLDLGSPDAAKRLKGLMVEDPEIAQKREDLTLKIERLEKIEAELRILLA